MIEDELAPVAPNRRFYFNFLLPLLVKPRSTLEKIVAQARGTWLTPLLVLSLLMLLAVLIGGPIRKQAALTPSTQLPENYQYFSPEQQKQFQAAQTSQAGTLFVYVFPAVSSLAGIWVSWLLLGGMLHLLLTFMGSRSSSASAMSLSAWAMLPYALRSLVQAGGMLATHSLITHPGLSGFASDGAGLAAFLAAWLGHVDLYLVWMAVLLVIGAQHMSGLKLGKVVASVAVVVILLISLQALPGFIGAQLNGLGTAQPFFFF